MTDEAPTTQREPRTSSGNLPAILTVPTFTRILQEMVGDKLLDLGARLSRIEEQGVANAERIASHKTRIEDLEREVRDLRAQVERHEGALRR